MRAGCGGGAAQGAAEEEEACQEAEAGWLMRVCASERERENKSNEAHLPENENERQTNISMYIHAGDHHLDVYNVPARFQTSKVFTIAQLLALVGDIYEKKVQSDDIDDKMQNHRMPIPEYIRDYMITKYGLKSIALGNLHAFVQATIKHASQDLRIQDFGVMSGILHSPGWNESLCDFALAGLQLVIRKDVIQEV